MGKRKRKFFSKGFRKKIFERDSYTCFKCKNVFPFKGLTVDHIIELHYGGSNKEDNLQTACHQCNQEKNDQKQRAESLVRKKMRYKVFKF